MTNYPFWTKNEDKGLLNLKKNVIFILVMSGFDNKIKYYIRVTVLPR